jgi:hypothetical protein
MPSVPTATNLPCIREASLRIGASRDAARLVALRLATGTARSVTRWIPRDNRGNRSARGAQAGQRQLLNTSGCPAKAIRSSFEIACLNWVSSTLRAAGS